MKKSILFFACLLVTVMTMAQDKKFSPEKFEADLECFIKKEAKLTDSESAKFFPLLREMHQKQRNVSQKMRNIGKEKPANEEAYAAAIRERDKLDIELKQLEQCYHKKMVQVIPASKVYDAIKAELRFHRQMMKGWQGQKSKPKDKR